jgi:hypothetical protein
MHIDHKKGVPGTLILLPTLDNQMPRAIYLSEKASQQVAVRLYLFNEEIPGFILVRDTNQGPFPDRGGLKLWRIDYPPNVITRHEYLETDFPTVDGLKQSWYKGKIDF